MLFRRISGFTLLELGIALVVLSLLLSGVLTIVNQNNRIAKQAELKTKMDVIESALIGFRKNNGRIPCPGPTAIGATPVSETHASFGLESSNPGTCTEAAAVFLANTNTVGGMVPVRSLGLSDDYAFDPWGGQFFYAVDKRMTSATLFAATTPTDQSNAGNITVKDSVEANRTTLAIVVVVSFGENGHGAYQASGARKYSDSPGAHELENCDCTASAPGTFNSVFYQEAASTNYDDVTRYYLRSQLTGANTSNSTNDTLTESP